MNKPLSSRFTVSIPVKPYVKRFLDINFGLPVDFTQNAHSHKHFQSLFKNPNTSQDKKYPDHICTYTEIVEVVISEHDFYRYGWELTKTNTIAFGKYYEERAKAMMRTYIGVNISLGVPINKSILKFQNRFVFEEEVWHYEAIKKDIYRNGKVELIDFNDEIFRKIEKIVLRNLYDLGTLSHQAIKEYETIE